jgi:hypothetical protein
MWFGPFKLLAQSGALLPPTHQLHRIRLALPYRLLGWRKIAVGLVAEDQAWQTRAGRFIATDGHAWCTNFHSGATGAIIEARLLRGEIPSPCCEPWVGTSTGNPSGTVAVPIGSLPRLVYDDTDPATRRRLEPGVMVMDYCSVSHDEIIQLMN